ncbi:TM2 domain-containing protein [uncultured Corynebacterium sp.]|uniref:TM2 domain-containing protein n=1 Tax=uncultured Corynebacterium sp. TaxID=159447 RepID=UPI00259A703C|nr:TM2 domain-containing protein [uncultured Corynebacterium sp.]
MTDPGTWNSSDGRPADESGQTGQYDPAGQYGQYPHYGQYPAQPAYGQYPPQGVPAGYPPYVPNAPYAPYAPYAQYSPYGAAPAYGMYPGHPGFSEKSKTTAAVLAFFLGWAGGHNFYLRRNGKALAQLLLSILGWIFIVVGIILAVNYDTGSSYYYDDGNEALFAMGIIMLFGTAYILFPAIGIWAFVEFILILTGSAGYATDDKGLVLR